MTVDDWLAPIGMSVVVCSLLVSTLIIIVGFMRFVDWLMERVFTPWYARRHGYTMDEWRELCAELDEQAARLGYPRKRR